MTTSKAFMPFNEEEKVKSLLRERFKAFRYVSMSGLYWPIAKKAKAIGITKELFFVTLVSLQENGFISAINHKNSKGERLYKLGNES